LLPMPSGLRCLPTVIPRTLSTMYVPSAHASPVGPMQSRIKGGLQFDLRPTPRYPAQTKSHHHHHHHLQNQGHGHKVVRTIAHINSPYSIIHMGPFMQPFGPFFHQSFYSSSSTGRLNFFFGFQGSAPLP
jgi:hypothetical protein